LGNFGRKFERLNDDLIKFIRRVPSKPIIYYELKILSRLNFHTRVPLRALKEHMHSILKMLDSTLLDYLGEEAYQYYIDIIKEYRRNLMRRRGRRRHKQGHRHKRNHRGHNKNKITSQG
jgi:hypothetical protein